MVASYFNLSAESSLEELAAVVSLHGTFHFAPCCPVPRCSKGHPKSAHGRIKGANGMLIFELNRSCDGLNDSNIGQTQAPDSLAPTRKKVISSLRACTAQPRRCSRSIYAPIKDHPNSAFPHAMLDRHNTGRTCGALSRT